MDNDKKDDLKQKLRVYIFRCGIHTPLIDFDKMIKIIEEVLDK